MRKTIEISDITKTIAWNEFCAKTANNSATEKTLTEKAENMKKELSEILFVNEYINHYDKSIQFVNNEVKKELSGIIERNPKHVNCFE